MMRRYQYRVVEQDNPPWTFKLKSYNEGESRPRLFEPYLNECSLLDEEGFWDCWEDVVTITWWLTLSAHFGPHLNLSCISQCLFHQQALHLKTGVQTQTRVIMMQLHSDDRYHTPSPPALLAATMNSLPNTNRSNLIQFGPHHLGASLSYADFDHIVVIIRLNIEDPLPRSSESGNFWANSSFLRRSQKRCRV